MVFWPIFFVVVVRSFQVTNPTCRRTVLRSSQNPDDLDEEFKKVLSGEIKPRPARPVDRSKRRYQPRPRPQQNFQDLLNRDTSFYLGVIAALSFVPLLLVALSTQTTAPIADPSYIV